MADAFYGLTGQQAVKDKLSELLRGAARGHAHLFTGEAGTGKFSFARAFAKALLCGGGPADSTQSGRPFSPPCGACASCGLFGSGAHDDYLCIEPTGQGQKPVIPVDAIRRITNWIYLRPLYSTRKVCVIARADHMTEQAQNALLKTLEEPPPYGILILTAASEGMLLETARSRCAVTRFGGYSDDELSDILNASDSPPDKSVTRLFIRLSGGNPGYALELAGSGTFMSLRGELLNLFCGCLDNDAHSYYMLPAHLERNRERFSQQAGIMVHWLRDLWICSVYGTPGTGGFGAEADALISNGDMAQRLEKYRGRFRPGALLDCMERIDETCSAVAANANFTLAVNAMLYKINDLLE